MLAPDAETDGGADPLLPPEVDQLIEYRTREPRLQPIADQYIWAGRGIRGIDRDSQRMRSIGGHNFVQIGSEAQHLALSRARRIELDRQERRVLHADACALRGCYQPIGTVRFAPEDRGEELNQARSRDWRLAVEPATIPVDAHADLAEISRRRPTRSDRPSGGLARQLPQRPQIRLVRHRAGASLRCFS